MQFFIAITVWWSNWPDNAKLQTSLHLVHRTVIVRTTYSISHAGQESILQYPFFLSLSVCVWLEVCEMNYGKMLNEACKWMTYCINSDILYSRYTCVCLFVSTEYFVSFSAHSWPWYGRLEQKPFGHYMMVYLMYFGLPINRILGLCLYAIGWQLIQ